MKPIIYHKYSSSGDLELHDVDEPVVKDDEVLKRLAYLGPLVASLPLHFLWKPLRFFPDWWIRPWKPARVVFATDEPDDDVDAQVVRDSCRTNEPCLGERPLVLRRSRADGVGIGVVGAEEQLALLVHRDRGQL